MFCGEMRKSWALQHFFKPYTLYSPENFLYFCSCIADNYQMMNATDILNGIMRITVLVAITRPTEFIEITFQQQMQKS